MALNCSALVLKKYCEILQAE